MDSKQETQETKKGYLEVISAVGLWGLNNGITVRLINISAFLLYPIASLFGFLVVAGELVRKKRLSKALNVSRKPMLLWSDYWYS